MNLVPVFKSNFLRMSTFFIFDIESIKKENYEHILIKSNKKSFEKV